MFANRFDACYQGDLTPWNVLPDFLQEASATDIMGKFVNEGWWKQYKTDMISCGAGNFRSPDLLFNPGVFAPFVMGGAVIQMQENIIRSAKAIKAAEGCSTDDEINIHHISTAPRTHNLNEV